MKLLFVLAFVAVVAARPEDQYARLENFNFDEIVGNKRLLLAYCDCFLGKANCTPEGKEIKNKIQEALQTNCNKCQESQKSVISQFIIAIQEQLPEEWEEINKQFNPDGKYDEKLKVFLAKYKQ